MITGTETVVGEQRGGSVVLGSPATVTRPRLLDIELHQFRDRSILPTPCGRRFEVDLETTALDRLLAQCDGTARPDPQEAALKAWTEALTLQEGSRDLLEPKGLLRDAIAKGQLKISLKAWRADRRYLDDFRADFHDVNDLMCQQQVFLDPRAQEQIRSLVWVPAVRALATVSSLPDRSLHTYQTRVESRGYEVLYVDVTTPDVALVGLRVVRVLIPGLAPNFPAALPCLGQKRIQNAAVELGWRAEPRPDDDLNYFPLPHA